MYNCSFCKKECKSYLSQRTHESLCKENPNRHERCSEIWRKSLKEKVITNQYVKAHVLGLPIPPNPRRITGEFICNTCNSIFSTRKDLKQHRKESHPSKNSAGNRSIPETKCTFCERLFTNSSALTIHERYCRNNPNRLQKEGIPHTKEIKEKISKRMKEVYEGKSIWNTQLEKRKSYAETYFDSIFPDAEFNYHIDRFFLDLAWPDKKIYIEIDGNQHYNDEKVKLHDIERTQILLDLGWVLIERVNWSSYQKLSDVERKNYIETLKKKIAEWSSGLSSRVS